MWKNRAQNYVRPSPQYSFINSGGRYITDPLPQYGAPRRLSMYELWRLCAMCLRVLCSDTEFRHLGPDEDGGDAIAGRGSTQQHWLAGWLGYIRLQPSQMYVYNFYRADWDSWFTLWRVRKAHLNRIKRMPCYSFYLQFLPQLSTSFLHS